ncbi:MAG: hypothetical protein WD737_12330 [Gemmatimonadota bacterium]
MSHASRSFSLLIIIATIATGCFGDEDADVDEFEVLPPGQETDTVTAPVVPPAPSTPQ